MLDPPRLLCTRTLMASQTKIPASSSSAMARPTLIGPHIFQRRERKLLKVGSKKGVPLEFPSINIYIYSGNMKQTWISKDHQESMFTGEQLTELFGFYASSAIGFMVNSKNRQLVLNYHEILWLVAKSCITKRMVEFL